MTFLSFPYAPRTLQATESRLKAIMDAARLGLKGDRLAIAAGMMPTEYRQLCQFDPIVEYAELKARTESEMAMSQVLHDAAAQGDIKAATTILQSQHDWVQKQSIQVDIDQRISITQALELAQQRVAPVIMNETPDRANDQGLLINNRKEDGDDYTDFKPSKAKRTA
jgi:hydroxypyruvate isomerase